MKKSLESKEESPSLKISRSEAGEKLRKRVEDGNEIRNTQVHTEEELETLNQKYKKWSDFNVELLSRIFNNEVIAEEYKSSRGASRVAPDSLWGNPFPTLYENFLNRISAKLNTLESIIERLELIPEVSQISSTELKQKTSENSYDDKVFIVHGHDEEAKQSVARFIENLGLKAIILHEQPNKGRTIINKFEDYSQVGFAVVLLTPDDVGSSFNKQTELRPRARQNVIFELGFFIGRLGTERVCALCKGDIELPSDYQGVLWIKMDSNSTWQFELSRELKAVGYKIDLNKLV